MKKNNEPASQTQDGQTSVLPIAEGVRMHFIKATKFKTTSVCIILRQPLAREHVTANALIPNVIQRGSMKYDTLSKINSHMENMYGSVFDAQIIKKGEQQILQFYVSVNHMKRIPLFRKSLEFLQEIMLHPLIEGGGFKASYVEGEKENLRIAIESRINHKGEYAKLRCLEEMCRNEPFGLYGDGYIQDLDDNADMLSPAGLYRQYRSLMKHAPIDIVVIGDEDEKNAETLIKQSFSFEREPAGEIPKAAFDVDAGEVKIINEKSDITQGKICMGLRTGVDPASDQFYHLMLASDILGGGAHSKLFVHVREKESLCYYISSFIYRFKSIMMIQSGVDEENFDKVFELTEREINKIKKGEITDEEMDAARKSLAKKYIGLRDSPSYLMDYVIGQNMLGDTDGLEDAVRKISQIRKEDVAQAAQGLAFDTVYRLGRGGNGGKL